MFLSLAYGLIDKGAISTTLAKAKTTKRIVEKLVTLGKKGDVPSRRKVQSFLRNKQIANFLVDKIGPLFVNRPGGYLRLIHFPPRKGDSAQMARLEFIEYPVKEKAEKKKIKPEEEKKGQKIIKKEPVEKIKETTTKKNGNEN